MSESVMEKVKALFEDSFNKLTELTCRPDSSKEEEFLRGRLSAFLEVMRLLQEER